MIKCVVFDIGNTLISKSGNNVVNPVLKSDIKRLREQGLIVGVASMRTLLLSEKLLQGIDFDFYICLSGAQIYINDLLHYDQPIENITSNHPCVVYYSEKETYALSEDCAVKARNKGFVVENVKDNHDGPLYNVALIDINQDEIEPYKSRYHIEYWSKISVLVIQDMRSSKADAISFIADYYDLNMSEILGFGDGPNDIEFLSICGTSVAMGYDYKELVDSTTFSTENESKLGVSKALRKLNLIQDTVVLFLESLNDIGGMEIHGQYFIEYFKSISNLYVITHNNDKNILAFMNGEWVNEYIDDISDFIKKMDSYHTMIFFNSGHWIEEMSKIKMNIKKSVVFYRTGGNDIISAPTFDENHDPSYRTVYWRSTINQCVDYLITNSRLTETRLIDFGIHEALFNRVVGGVDLKKIAYFRNQIKSIREELMFDKQKTNLVSVSRFEPYKRVELLLKTLKFLNKDLFHLYLIGDGQQFSELYSNYHHLKNVTFLGRLNHDESLKYICSADFYVQFSGDTDTDLNGVRYIHTEGMGRTILEAITAGTPIIATKCGAFSEIISSKNGLLIDSNDPKELADKIVDATFMSFSGNSNDCYDFSTIFDQYLRIWKGRGHE